MYGLLITIKPDESALIIARDFLIEKRVFRRIVTDEWSLDVVEYKEAAFANPAYTNHDWKWIFPLPILSGVSWARTGALNIAWTALQIDWSTAAEEEKICQLTHPEKVHEFLRKWPGLYECAESNAPDSTRFTSRKITIPRFDSGFEDSFDELMKPENYDCKAAGVCTNI